MPTLDFSGFRASGADCADLGAALSDAWWADTGYVGQGRIYLGSFAIERRPASGWPAGNNEEWCLVLFRDTFYSDDLVEVEARLYAFAVNDEYIQQSKDFAYWVRRLGLGFHPDTRGPDYYPALTDDEIVDYELAVDREIDPYARAMEIWREDGLLPPSVDDDDE
jgi:hypothetical protein